MEEDIKPVKTYVVKTWEIRLKSGAAATYNIREDQGEYFQNLDGWWVWQWPSQKRFSRIREEEIAAEDYAEVEMKEIKLYKPKSKKGALVAETQETA